MQANVMSSAPPPAMRAERALILFGFGQSARTIGGEGDLCSCRSSAAPFHVSRPFRAICEESGRLASPAVSWVPVSPADRDLVVQDRLRRSVRLRPGFVLVTSRLLPGRLLTPANAQRCDGLVYSRTDPFRAFVDGRVQYEARHHLAEGLSADAGAHAEQIGRKLAEVSELLMTERQRWLARASAPTRGSLASSSTVAVFKMIFPRPE